MKNRIIKTITMLVLVMAMIASLAIVASASETEGTNDVETFTVNGVEIPKFDFVIKPYQKLEDAGLPLAEIREAFNILPEFKYENGKYMISDIGADHGEVYNSRDYEYIDLVLEDGYWVAEIPEADFNDPDLRWNVYFWSEENQWQFYYHDKDPDRRVQFNNDVYTYSIGIYINSSEDWVDASYSAMDRQCYDYYSNGVLEAHEVTCYFDDQEDWFSVEYNPDKTVNNAKIWHDVDGTYYYLIPEHGWYSIPQVYPEYKIDTPVGYEDMDIEYFVSFAPCIIDCTHENLILADCENPDICAACGVVPEGSTPLGHDMVVDEGKEPTCTETGLTEGAHCSRCDDMTTVQIEVPALDHDMVIDEGKDPTCTETGLTEGEHCLRCDDATVEQEEIPALDHDIIVEKGKDPTCTETGLTEGAHCSRCDDATVAQEEIPALDHDWQDATYDAPKTCSLCGESEGEPLVRDTEPVEKESNTEDVAETNTGEGDGNNESSTQATQGTIENEDQTGCGATVGMGAAIIVVSSVLMIALKKKREY